MLGQRGDILSLNNIFSQYESSNPTFPLEEASVLHCVTHHEPSPAITDGTLVAQDPAG